MGKSLKSALQSQQSRLRWQQKALQAVQAAEQKLRQKCRGKRKGTEVATSTTKRQTITFRPMDKVLLIGEGNFSFTRALVQLYDDESVSGGGGSSTAVFMPPTNITATAYDLEEDCYAKYPNAKEIVKQVAKSGVQVLFGVDATKLHKIHALKGKKWDKIIWNFPHAGKGIADQDRNVLSNQLLVLAFLRSAASALATGPIPTVLKPKKKNKSIEEDEEGNDDIHQEIDDKTSDSVEKTRGTVLITLRNVPPYTLWDVPRLAKKPPPPAASASPHPRFIQLRSFTFLRSAWPGYEHRMTKGERAHGMGTPGEGGEDRTWEFCLRDL